MEAAHKAQEVFELTEKIKAKGIDTLDAEEFLEETRRSLQEKNYTRALRMAKLAEKSLIILVDQSDIPNEDVLPESILIPGRRPQPPKDVAWEVDEDVELPPPPPAPEDETEEPLAPPEPEDGQEMPPPPEEEDDDDGVIHPPPPPPEPETPAVMEPEEIPPDTEASEDASDLSAKGPQEDEDEFEEMEEEEVEAEVMEEPEDDDEDDDIDIEATVELSKDDIDLGGKGVKDFKIEKKLGSGGFADVFLAKDKSGRSVALKLPHKEVFQDMDNKNRDRFLEEAENWAKLFTYRDVKKGIVAIYSYAVEPDPYIAMEYMDSGSLRGLIESMTNEEKLHVLKKILNTLYTVHHLGVIHRDIKPENILLNSQGQWKIADWGLSKTLLDSTATQTQAGTIKATLAYASPEQIEPDDFGDVDWRTDIYQVGALAYELFTGKKPFEGDPAKIVYSVVAKDPVHPCEVSKEVPRHIGDAIMKSMEKKKKKRWQDAVLFKRALAEEAASEPGKKKGMVGGFISSVDTMFRGKKKGAAPAPAAVATEPPAEKKEVLVVEEEKKGPSEEEVKQERDLETYRDLLAEAMADGDFTSDEERMLGKMRTNLNITIKQHNALVKELDGQLMMQREAGGTEMASSTPVCHKCGNHSSYIKEYSRFYCYHCREYVATDTGTAPACTSCGKSTKWIENYKRFYCYTCNMYAPLGPEIKVGGQRQTAVSKSCPTCKHPATYLNEYQRWFCTHCNNYLPSDGWTGPACQRCGHRMIYVDHYKKYYCSYCNSYL
jgi:tRNA A-37 threonylcarbamoyl transferase component Bud32